MKNLLLVFLFLSPVLASAQYHHPAPQPPDDVYYPTPPPQQPQPQAVLVCNIDYTNPSGSKNIRYVNQPFVLPISSTAAYFDTINLDGRELDYVAENINGRKMVGLTLWHYGRRGTICNVEREGTATCAYADLRTREFAQIDCRRVD